MNYWNYDDARMVAETTVKYSAWTSPPTLVAGAVQKLLERIDELEATQTPSTAPNAVTAYLRGWKDAREYYGTTDEEDRVHGAECATVLGPYRCTCDAEAEMDNAHENAVAYVNGMNR